MGDGSFLSGNLLIDPGFPFFYLPVSFFKSIVDTFNNAPITYPDAEFTYERIKFNTMCSGVKPYVTTDFSFELTSEENIVKTFSFHLAELLIDGAHFGEPGSCYIGVFPNTNAPYPTMAYAGALFLKKYYTFFDMSGYDADSFFLGQTLRVGIGLKNSKNLILDEQYNKFSESYAPYMHDQSNFTFTPNKFTSRKMEDPISQQELVEPTNKIMILVISISVVVFLIVVLVTLIVLKRRQIAKRKMEVYKELTNERDINPGDLGEAK